MLPEVAARLDLEKHYDVGGTTDAAKGAYRSQNRDRMGDDTGRGLLPLRSPEPSG